MIINQITKISLANKLLGKWVWICLRLLMCNGKLYFGKTYLHTHHRCWASWWLSSKEPGCSAGDVGSILGWEDPLEEGTATHSSVPAWRVPVDRGAWWATAHRIAESWTWLKQLSTQAHTHKCWGVWLCTQALSKTFTYISMLITDIEYFIECFLMLHLHILLTNSCKLNKKNTYIGEKIFYIVRQYTMK